LGVFFTFAGVGLLIGATLLFYLADLRNETRMTWRRFIAFLLKHLFAVLFVVLVIFISGVISRYIDWPSNYHSGEELAASWWYKYGPEGSAFFSSVLRFYAGVVLGFLPGLLIAALTLTFWENKHIKTIKQNFNATTIL
jgi:hypothetical protein